LPAFPDFDALAAWADARDSLRPLLVSKAPVAPPATPTATRTRIAAPTMTRKRRGRRAALAAFGRDVVLGCRVRVVIAIESSS
jgi:hypothetical protein